MKTDKKIQKEIQKNWKFFWAPLLMKPDGTIDLEQVKKELYDFYFVMHQVPIVYCHITGNTLSKIMYDAKTVIAYADDYGHKWYVEELKNIKDDINDIVKAGGNLDDVIEYVNMLV